MLARLARTPAATNAWEIADAASAPPSAPDPAAIVEKTAIPIVPPISCPVELSGQHAADDDADRRARAAKSRLAVPAAAG